MTPLLLALGSDPAVLLLAGSGDSGVAVVALPFVAGPVTFGLVYGAIYRYYRNTDKRHAFERKTDVNVGNLEASQSRTGSRRRLRTRSMENRNEGQPLSRVRRLRLQ